MLGWRTKEKSKRNLSSEQDLSRTLRESDTDPNGHIPRDTDYDSIFKSARQ